MPKATLYSKVQLLRSGFGTGSSHRAPQRRLTCCGSVCECDATARHHKARRTAEGARGGEGEAEDPGRTTRLSPRGCPCYTGTCTAPVLAHARALCSAGTLFLRQHQRIPVRRWSASTVQQYLCTIPDVREFLNASEPGHRMKGLVGPQLVAYGREHFAHACQLDPNDLVVRLLWDLAVAAREWGALSLALGDRTGAASCLHTAG